MTTAPKPCPNCAGTGWVSYEVPSAVIDGVIHIRERINPCHACNAEGWKQWAQQVVSSGYKR
jgi:hypothetical protein